jgi:nitroimidazol reductase NimA-like FMN-containing flavoprotein (pyridoxamine 5'-phosphate oxidase superfamily)
MSAQSESGGRPINYVRRRDRAADDDGWIRDFLNSAKYGVVATESCNQPFINPLLFTYDEESGSLYFHTGRAGRVFANIESNDRVCFNVAQMGELVSDTNAWRFDVEYESVIVFGRARVIVDEGEATRALRMLLEKYFPELRYGEDYDPIGPEMLARTAVYRVQIDSWSGKRNPAGSDSGES